MRSFFYSKGWSLDGLRSRWYSIVRDSGFVYKVHGRVLLAGDGVKQSKEAFYMPGNKKQKQESEDSSKEPYIFGHLFGAVGVILGNPLPLLCLNLKVNIQDGLSIAADWNNSFISSETHVIQMIQNSFDIAKTFGKSLVALDRYFLSVKALEKLRTLNSEYCSDENLLEIVTKAKSNCVAYQKPPKSDPHKRGRRRIKGAEIHLRNLWKQSELFEPLDVCIYGKETSVRYYSCDLLWGNGLYQELRFVLVFYGEMSSILVSTDLSLSPREIIEVYSLRFKIESSFREFKQQFGGFSYHFWTKALSKLNHFKKKEEPDPLDMVLDEHDRQLILSKVKAIEGFVLVASISMGLTQMLTIQEALDGSVQPVRYLRTPPQHRVSEASVIYYLRKAFFPLMLANPHSFITRFISEKQNLYSCLVEVA